jgi:hypothetical protein
MPMPTHWQADTMDSRRFSMRLTGEEWGLPRHVVRSLDSVSCP